MKSPLPVIRQATRGAAARLMAVVDRLTHGRITPAAITITGLLMHLPVALLIGSGHFLWAAALLIVFGLFDVLDGALAKVQGTTSERGMLLDASTDRFKEVMLFAGAAYVLSDGPSARLAVTAAVVACGASVCVSYVKAKGEAAVASLDRKIPHAVLNRMFSDGLLTFEIRVAIMAAGLLFDQLLAAVVLIAIFASLTAVQRLVTISRRL